MKRYRLWAVFSVLFVFAHQGRAEDAGKSTLTSNPKDIGKQIKVEGNTYLDVPDIEALDLEITIMKGETSYKVVGKTWEIPTPGETTNYSAETETNLDAGTYWVSVTFWYTDGNQNLRSIKISKTLVVQ